MSQSQAASLINPKTLDIINFLNIIKNEFQLQL